MNTSAVEMNSLYSHVETRDRRMENDCIEVTVLWRGTVQEVMEIEPDKQKQARFHVGEAPDCQFMVPADALGGEPRFELASLKGGGPNG